MQLHAYLFLFIITTGKVSTVLYDQCGTVHMDQETSGNITITLPGALVDTNSPTHHQTEDTLQDTVCTWVIDIPSGQAVRLELVWVDGASRVSVLCGRDRGEQPLEAGEGALLSGCDRDRAALTWKVEGDSPHTIQLSYYAQEVGRNSSERPTSVDQDRLSATPPTSQTGPVLTSGTPAVPQRGREDGEGADRGRGHHSPRQAWSPGPRSASAPSHKDQGLPQPPSPLPGLGVAGQADREAPPLPQEEPDNGADTSGAARVTEGRDLAGEKTHTHVNTRHTQTADTHSHRVLSTETNSRTPHAPSADAHSHTHSTYTLTHLAVSNPAVDMLTGTGVRTDTEIHTVGHTDTRTATRTSQSDPTVPNSHALPLAHSPPQPSLVISSAPSGPWEVGTTLIPHGNHVPGEPGHSQPPAWRSQRSTDRLHPSLTPEVTPDPVKSPSDPDSTDTGNKTAAASASSSAQAPGRTSRSPTAHSAELDSSDGAKLAVSSFPGFTRRTETSVSVESDLTSQTAGVDSSAQFENGEMLHTLPPHSFSTYTQSQTNTPQSQHTDSLTHSPPPHTLTPYTQTNDRISHTETHGAHSPSHFSDRSTYETINNPREFPVSPASASSPDNARDYGRTTSPRGLPPSTTAPLTLGDVVQKSTATTVSDPFLSSDVTMATTTNVKGEEPLQATGTATGSHTFSPTPTLLADASHTGTHTPLLTTSPTLTLSLTPAVLQGDASPPEYTLQTQTTIPDHTTRAPLRSTTPATEPPTHVPFADHKTMSTPLPAHTQTHKHTLQTHTLLPLPSPTTVSTHRPFPDHITTTRSTLTSYPPTSTQAGQGGGRERGEKERDPFVTTVAPPLPPQPTTAHHSLTVRTTSRSPELPPPSPDPYPSQGSPSAGTASASAPSLDWSSSTTQTPRFYIVPDQPATIQVESIELLLQIILEEPNMALSTGLEEDTTAWVEPYLLRAPGFSRLLAAWSSGRAVQSLVEFRTRGALDWLGMAGPGSLLERTGLAQAVREGRSFRGSRVTNITLGGQQGAVCDWLLRCPAGYECVSQPGAANSHGCSSVCHSDYCHHHGICTHHPAELPVCRCLAGEDSWYVGQRCDVRMTQARLVGACLAALIAMVTLIGILALVAVRRYRTILIQAKVDQTRSSYRRFNHFDELSGRFWLRSWAGSADSLDNPAFTRSDELLHLRALDRTCCYHDDTLSLASTCPSHGAHINTVYPHSSQYGWRGSEMSMGECVLDSGKASDLSVCSWPVEPIHWTPFPLLQQLASHAHRTPTVRASRTRSYCEGMELVDLGKSWTA